MRRELVIALCVWLVLAAAPAGQRGRGMPTLDWGPYDITQLGLGTKATAFIVLEGSDCTACVESMAFYKRLMRLPEMDGKVRRVVVIAKAGVWPVKTVTDAHGFMPHRLNSGPYMLRPVPGVTKAPTVLVLDAKGVQRGKWEGALSAKQENEVIAALTTGTRRGSGK